MLEKQGSNEKLANIANLDFEFNHVPFSSREKMIETNKITFGYDENDLLIEKLSFQVGEEDKICIIGKNGKVVDTFASFTKPTSKKFIKLIDKLI